MFPADLFIGAGAHGVPVARSEQGVFAADYRPSGNMRVGFQAYQRRANNVLLVAPFSGEPFATGAFGVGRSTSRGLAVDASVTAPRFGIVGSYGLQHVRNQSSGIRYVPGHGATHLFQGGVMVYPTPSSSIRLGVTGSAGRRTTSVTGPFEWESCNLKDRGCEFGGSPRIDGETLGGSTLPMYARVDLGVRKQWQLAVGKHDAMIALFGAATNLFGRRNLLTFSRDPLTGTRAPIEMSPFAPLVVGMEWKF